MSDDDDDDDEDGMPYQALNQCQ